MPNTRCLRLQTTLLLILDVMGDWLLCHQNRHLVIISRPSTTLGSTTANESSRGGGVGRRLTPCLFEINSSFYRRGDKNCRKFVGERPSIHFLCFRRHASPVNRCFLEKQNSRLLMDQTFITLFSQVIQTLLTMFPLIQGSDDLCQFLDTGAIWSL